MNIIQIIIVIITFCLFIGVGIMLVRFPEKMNPIIWGCFGINKEKIAENRRTNPYFRKQLRIVGYGFIYGTIIGGIIYLIIWVF